MNIFIAYLDCALIKTKSFLYNRGKFTNSTSLLTKNILCTCGQDNDLCPDWSHTDLNTTIAIFSQFTSKELI